MKKNVSMLLVLLLVLSLAGCGASGSDAATTEMAPQAAYDEFDTYAYNGTEAEVADYDSPAEAPAPEEAAAAPAASGDLSDSGITSGSPAAADFSEKIIYSAYAEIETKDFDAAVEQVYALMDRYGAFLENSSVTGTNLTDSYYGRRSNRTANFTLRVPKDRYSAMTSALGEVGNVTLLNSSADNITSQYTDVESHLAAYETEESRLLELLGRAETVEDMITIESRLSEIRYEKEWMTSQLKNWDNQVAYSSVTLNLTEVRELTPEPEPEPETYLQRMGRGFTSTLKGVGEFFSDLLVAIVTLLPVLVILAVIVVVIVLLVRRSAKKRRAARAAMSQGPAQAPRNSPVPGPQNPPPAPQNPPAGPQDPEA